MSKKDKEEVKDAPEGTVEQTEQVEETTTDKEPNSGSAFEEAQEMKDEPGQDEINDIEVDESSNEDSDSSPDETEESEDNSKGSEKIDGALGNDQQDSDLGEPDVNEKEDAAEEEEKVEDPMAQKIRMSREDLDFAMQCAATIFNKRSALWVSIFRAKAWLGKLRGHLGHANPYLTDEPVKTPKQIPPTADVANNPTALYQFQLKDEIDRITYLRDVLQEVVEVVSKLNIDDHDVDDVRLAKIAITNSYTNICNARFELGNELAIIRER